MNSDLNAPLHYIATFVPFGIIRKTQGQLFMYEFEFIESQKDHVTYLTKYESR